jgi:hypothetical protein
MNQTAKNFSIDFEKGAEEPFGKKLYQSLEYLDFKARAITNAVEAYKTIEKIVSEQRNFKLFQKLFPNEWEKSKTSLFKKGYYRKYTEKTNELFELINKNMFPLLSGWNDDPETEFESLYIFSLNLDLCCEEIDYESLRVSYVATLLIFSRDEEAWEYFATKYKIEAEEFPEIHGRSNENIWKMEKTGRQGLFLDIFEIVDHSTGNPWLDTVNCRNDEWFDWNENTVKYLAQSFNKAKDLLDRTRLLDEIFEADPRRTLMEMITFWNDGKVKGEKNRAAGKKRISEDSPLDFYDY